MLTWAEPPIDVSELLLYPHFHLLQLLECSGLRWEEELQIWREGQDALLAFFPFSHSFCWGRGKEKQKQKQKKPGQVDMKVNSTFVARIQNSYLSPELDSTGSILKQEASSAQAFYTMYSVVFIFIFYCCLRRNSCQDITLFKKMQ